MRIAAATKKSSCPSASPTFNFTPQGQLGSHKNIDAGRDI